MKPLSRDEFQKLREFLGDGTDNRCSLNQFWSQKVIAAEKFWREAVRNAPESCDTGPSSGMCWTCMFCKEDGSGAQEEPIHKSDCPWLIANLD